jgi:CspA family cold shock protein
VDGSVILWNEEEGWGVLVSPDVDGTVWSHFSAIDTKAYASLTAGQAVTFTYETPGQDGHAHRALGVQPH